MSNVNNQSSSFDKKVLDELLERPMTTYDIREMGPFHPAGVISRLRKNYAISTTRVKVTDEHGIIHSGVALYRLEPAGGDNE